MTAKRTILLVPLTILCLLSLGFGFRFGPPAGVTGAPGESTCVVCHSTYALNSGPATFRIDGPETMAQLATVPLQVVFSSSTQPLHGFQITARSSDQVPAGAWNLTNPGTTQLSGPNHVSHTFNGTLQASWGVEWMPLPAAVLPKGPVTFYAAGNDANGNGSPSSDRIHTATHMVYQAGLSSPAMVWSLGTTQALDLDAPTVPGHLYVVAVSDSILTPTLLDPVLAAPLDLGSPLTPLGFTLPSVFQGFSGMLDAQGRAQAQVAIPSLPLLSGLTVHFAFATVDPSTLAFSEVSNRVSRTLQ